MDADIQAALGVTPTAHESLYAIAVQDARNKSSAILTEERVRTNTLVSASGTMQGVAADLIAPDAEIRLEIVKAIAANYMTPTAGAFQSTIDADTKADAARLKAAVDAVFLIVKGSGA